MQNNGNWHFKPSIGTINVFQLDQSRDRTQLVSTDGTLEEAFNCQLLLAGTERGNEYHSVVDSELTPEDVSFLFEDQIQSPPNKSSCNTLQWWIQDFP